MVEGRVGTSRFCSEVAFAKYAQISLNIIMTLNPTMGKGYKITLWWGGEDHIYFIATILLNTCAPTVTGQCDLLVLYLIIMMILIENYLMLVYKWKNWGLRKTQDHSTNHWEIYFFILSLFMCNMFWTIPDPRIPWQKMQLYSQHIFCISRREAINSFLKIRLL